MFARPPPAFWTCMELGGAIKGRGREPGNEAGQGHDAIFQYGLWTVSTKIPKQQIMKCLLSNFTCATEVATSIKR